MDCYSCIHDNISKVFKEPSRRILKLSPYEQAMIDKQEISIKDAANTEEKQMVKIIIIIIMNKLLKSRNSRIAKLGQGGAWVCYYIYLLRIYSKRSI